MRVSIIRIDSDDFIFQIVDEAGQEIIRKILTGKEVQKIRLHENPMQLTQLPDEDVSFIYKLSNYHWYEVDENVKKEFRNDSRTV